MESIVYRNVEPEDVSFIYATWLRGQRFGNDFFEAIDQDIYYSKYAAYIKTILERPDITVKVACLKDEPDIVVAFSVFSSSCIYWCHTKAAWRGMGIQKNMIPSSIVCVNGLTKPGNSIRLKKNWYLNPWS
jgi:hypothetical protein